MTETTQADTFTTWAVLDLFGRQRAAGHLTEIKRGGKDFLRLQIPATNGTQARTIDYSPDAVYGIEYVDEETARLVASYDRPPEPISIWKARTMVAAGASQLAIEPPEDDDDDDPEDPF
jgi:hypothetical protein